MRVGFPLTRLLFITPGRPQYADQILPHDGRTSQYDHAVQARRLLPCYRRVVHVRGEAILIREIKILAGLARRRIIDRNIRSQAPAQEAVGDEKLLPASSSLRWPRKCLPGTGPTGAGANRRVRR